MSKKSMWHCQESYQTNWRCLVENLQQSRFGVPILQTGQEIVRYRWSRKDVQPAQMCELRDLSRKCQAGKIVGLVSIFINYFRNIKIKNAAIYPAICWLESSKPTEIGAKLWMK
jgi:hypothetical protein